MKKNKKVLMTSEKTWISKEAWDFQKKRNTKLTKEWMKHFFKKDDTKEPYAYLIEYITDKIYKFKNK